MPKNRILLIIVFLTSFSGYGQTTIDSLENQLSKSLPDSLKIVTLFNLSVEYQYQDFNKSQAFANQGFDLANQKGWNWAKAKALERRSFLNSINGDFISALRDDQELLKLSISMIDSTAITTCLNYLGFDYQELGEFDEAYYYYSQTYRMAVAIKNPAKISTAYINLASIFKELGQYDEALNYLELCKKINLEIKNSTAQPFILEEAGDIYLRKNQLDKAKEALLLSLRLTREQKEFILEPAIFQKLAEVSLASNNYTSAFAYYDSASIVYKKSNNQFGVAQVKLGEGKIFLKQGKYDSALRLTEESQALSHSLNARKAESDCLNQLGELAEMKNDFKKALYFYKKAKALGDSLVSRETLTKTFQNQMRFDADIKNSEIAELTDFKKKQTKAIKQEAFIRNILVVAMALTAIVLFTVYRSGQRRLRINKLLLEHQEEIKQRAIELEQLNKVKDKFFSIISHDLRSPINSLSAILTLMENQNLKPEEFSRLAKELKLQFNNTKTLINNLLDWALMQMDKLKVQPVKINLLELANENYKLLSTLHLKEISFNNSIPENCFGLADSNMINLVFRNLIMNALKFTESGGSIAASLQDKGTQYEICISDNGVGISEEVQKLIFEKTVGYTTRGTANEKGTGLGLILCKEFVERNGGQIRVESELGKGSKFYFTIPKFN